MILALLLVAQDVPAPPATTAPEEDEIVVQATFGRTTMLFDKGVDGKLRNCRVMVSSGSQRRDEAACQSTPVCYAKTRDTVDCVEFAVIEAATIAPRPAAKPPSAFALPVLGRPQPSLTPGQAGPLTPAEESRETERQRVKLPPLPKPPSDKPIITFGTGRAE